MNRKLIIILLLSMILTTSCTINNQNEAEKTVFAMDTTMTIKAYGSNSKQAVKLAVDEIYKLDSLFSVTNENSEISKLNKVRSINASKDTFDIISKGIDIAKKTDGELDISIYPVVKLWGFTTGENNVPSEQELKELYKHIDYKNIILNSNKQIITIDDELAEIDLGSIAKGYLSSKISIIFKELNCVGTISLGGNIHAVGKRLDGDSWRVAIQSPFNETEYAGILSVEDKAVITSGGYQRYFVEGGTTYHHIIDTETLHPADTDIACVTVVATDGTLADGLSTALFIMGKDKALDFWRENKDEFDLVIVTNGNATYITEGIKDDFEAANIDFEIAY